MIHEYRAVLDEVEIRPLSYEDSQLYRVLRNKNNHRKWFIYQDIISEEEQAVWYEHYLSDVSDAMFAIYYQDKFVGGNAVYHIDNSLKRGEYGRLLLDEGLVGGKGIGKVSTLLACSIAKDLLGLKELYLEVFPDNIPALKTYEYAGFMRRNKYDSVREKDMITLFKFL